jgi:phage tail protein X
MTEEAQKRKNAPIFSGLLAYFPDACWAVAECSKIANEQHNPGTEMHWDREKSGDELDSLSRHALQTGQIDSDGIIHDTKAAWRGMANLQKVLESRGEAPLSPYNETIQPKTQQKEALQGNAFTNTHPIYITKAQLY